MNYADLFRVTLPETALEVAALVVLLVDLGFLRKAALRVRSAVAALLGVAGCGAAWWTLQFQGHGGLSFGSSGESVLLSTGGFAQVAQTGILVLTALTLLLVIDSVVTRHVGEFVAVVLMAASGGLLIAAAQDLLVIFIGLELLSLGLYILTAFAKTSGKRPSNTTSSEACRRPFCSSGSAISMA
jgi:NADH-quinone oxidoreductase subunit N